MKQRGPRRSPPAAPTPPPGALSPRAAAFVAFAAVAVLGYALQRLAAAPTEPDPRTLGPTVHVGYYWRLSTALWWGLLAGIGAWRIPVAGALAARALPWIVAFATIAAFAVP